MTKPLVLCILDGCGIRENGDGNAFKNAFKPTFDYLWNNYPHSLLEASGSKVGLPSNQMGNSEVGHMNIGAGKVVYQPLEIINRSIRDKSFFKNKEILNVFNHVKKNNSKLHIIGLASDGGVHSHINHLFALLDMCKQNGVTNVHLHLCTDGRDVDPHSAYDYISKIQEKLKELKMGVIATIGGRYYLMDRDNNYDRLKKGYDAVVNGVGQKQQSIKEFVHDRYLNGITDEFLIPTIFDDSSKIEENDAVLTFNFRKDRLREFFTALTNPSFNEMKVKKFKNLKVMTMLPVTKSVIAPFAFDIASLDDNLGKCLEDNHLSQLRIAETEKYAHVTFFFDGGKEKDYHNERKILIPSPKVATYDLKPEMSAWKVTDTLISELDKDIYDVVILNYANGDMVGHTGNYDATVKAIEFLDKCIKRLYDKVMEKDGVLIITSDHGNCDIMWDENHTSVTSHTTSKVPFIITKKNIRLKDGKLSDISPTILELLNIIKPKQMTGDSLIEH